MLLHFVYRKVSAGKLQEAWSEGFANNTPGAEADLRKRMAEFTAMFNRDSLKGDRILLFYKPGAGTTVTFNGADMGTVPGHDFMVALLKVWFGDNPADRGLKEAISK